MLTILNKFRVLDKSNTNNAGLEQLTFPFIVNVAVDVARNNVDPLSVKLFTAPVPESMQSFTARLPITILSALVGTVPVLQFEPVFQLVLVVPSHITGQSTVIVMLLLVAVEAVWHAALLVITQLITSLLANVDVVYVKPVAPEIFNPFLLHW